MRLKDHTGEFENLHTYIYIYIYILIASINIYVRIKNPERWQPYRCLDTKKTLHVPTGMVSTSLTAAADYY